MMTEPIGSGGTPTFRMADFAGRMQQAARALWPDPGNPARSIYEDDINDVLTSRGIAINGVTNFRDNLPPAVGPTVRGNDFQSGHPNSQPSVASYGVSNFFTDELSLNDPSVQYMAIKFYKHSKYGPADFLDFQLPDGTYTNGVPNPDGTTILHFEDRFGNVTAFVPGDTVRWHYRRKRAINESEGFYAEDVRPFGFIVTDVTPNGFSFTVEELAHSGDSLEKAFQQSGDLVGAKTYRTTIFDPSLALIGDADYTWTIIDYLGGEQTGTGLWMDFTLGLDQPFTIRIERDRDGVIDTLELRERVNDFARAAGSAFIANAVRLPADFDANGIVDVADLGILASNWQTNVDGFAFGDADGNGVVDVADLGLLATQWQMTIAGFRAGDVPALGPLLAAYGLPATAVPEPAMTALGAIAAAAVLLRRRHRLG